MPSTAERLALTSRLKSLNDLASHYKNWSGKEESNLPNPVPETGDLPLTHSRIDLDGAFGWICTTALKFCRLPPYCLGYEGMVAGEGVAPS